MIVVVGGVCFFLGFAFGAWSMWMDWNESDRRAGRR